MKEGMAMIKRFKPLRGMGYELTPKRLHLQSGYQTMMAGIR
jgi:hypothetical protein